jgi:hypothetical protein
MTTSRSVTFQDKFMDKRCSFQDVDKWCQKWSQSVDTKLQRFMWTKLNETMLKHGFPKPNSKRFMTDIGQANWNIVRIV